MPLSLKGPQKQSIALSKTQTSICWVHVARDSNLASSVLVPCRVIDQQSTAWLALWTQSSYREVIYIYPESVVSFTTKEDFPRMQSYFLSPGRSSYEGLPSERK